MLQNYLTTFVRVLLRQKVYSAINVFGLALGIASALLIVVFVADEFSYDVYHKDADRIFRNEMYTVLNGVEANYAESSGSAVFFKDQITGVESVLRIRTRPVTPASLNKKTVSLEKLIDADSNFFSFFSFKLIAGNKAKALRGVQKIVLTEKTATSIFGVTKKEEYDELIGKVILLGEEKNAAEVTGVAANPPSNSHFHFDAIVSMETNDPSKDGTYFTVNERLYTYVKTVTPEAAATINKLLPKAIENIFDKEFSGVLTLAEFRRNGNEIYYHLEPITNIHLGSANVSEIEPKGNRQYLYLLSFVAAFIIILACINFMNLSTARAGNRAKEVGIRKVVGAQRRKLVAQFMLESFAYTLLALLISLALISITLSSFNFLTHKNLSIQQFEEPVLWVCIVSLVMAVGLISGSYPAFYLSKFKPAIVLKGKPGVSTRSVLRNALIVFQFVISASLIMATILVSQQIDYLQTLSPGFDKENIITLNNTSNLRNHEAFKNELKNKSYVMNVSYSSHLLSEIIPGIGARRLKGTESFQTFKGFRADEDYLSTMKLPLVWGRFFSKDFPSDSNAIVINETAANVIGLWEYKGNEQLEWIDGSHGIASDHVVGVIKDFNFESMKNSIGPLAIRPGGSTRLSIRISPGHLRQALDEIKSIWGKHSSAPFSYSFLDQDLQLQYQSEEQLARISIVFTVLSIAIACLGLFGLVTYMAIQRTKEIGIRKVLGASVGGIVVLLTTDFLKLVAIAFVIALPVSWYGMNEWLKTFPYRVDLSVTVAALAGSIIVLSALLTVAYQAIKAAMGNPVDSLKSE